MNPAILPDESGQLAGRPLEEWNGAYAKVESYFHALRIRNKPLLGQLVLRVLERAQRRAPAELNRSATQLAAEEMDRIVTEWFSEVLQTSPTNNDQTLSTRGRLALLLVAVFWLTHGGFGQVQARLLLLMDWFRQNG